MKSPSFENMLIPERAKILLYTLSQLGEIVTELKLQKLIFQMQNEAKVPGGYHYFEHYYGPYSRELNLDTSTLKNEGLLEKEIVMGREHLYWVFRITKQGRDYFNQCILPNIHADHIDRMFNILSEYSNYNHYDLAEQVYKQWGIKQPKKIYNEIKKLKTDLQAISNFWETMYFPECPVIAQFLAFSEYSQEALEKITETKDTVKKSILLSACRELNEMLSNVGQICSNEDICPIDAETGLCQKPDPSVCEVFNFIEDFCEQNEILPKLLNRNLTELMTEEEYKRLQKSFENFNL